jgi:hypothetical protein
MNRAEMPRFIILSLVVVAFSCGDNNAGNPDAAGSQHDASTQIDAPGSGSGSGSNPDTVGIATALGTPDGSASVAINGVTVTYIRPFVGSDDPAGFDIQAAQAGPALFVTVDPATLASLTPSLAVGDAVSFTITHMTTLDLERRADAITGITRSSTGADVSALATDISTATDLISNIGAYDSMLVSVTGAFGNSFAGAGTGFQSAELNTQGITGQSDLTFRVETGLVDALDMAPACTFTATDIPFSRFKSEVELDAYTGSDFSLTTCPAPVIANLAASSATTVVITFSRHIDMTTLDGSGDQFTFDGGLTVSGAVLSGKTVTLTTSTQTAGQVYTLTFAGTAIKDTMGNMFMPPTPNASVFGFTVQAGVVINELNANISKGCDLVELRVISDGTMGGFRLVERIGSLSQSELNYTFPQGFNVTKNAIVMFHESSGSAACNPNGATQEVTTTTDQPGSAYGGNYDTAFDFWGSDAGLVGTTDNVITLFDGTGTMIDTVFLQGSGSGASDTIAAANLAGAANQWSPAETNYSDADYIAAAVAGMQTTGGSATGTSIQRVSDMDTNSKADWAIAAETFGTINAGQATLPVLRHRTR